MSATKDLFESALDAEGVSGQLADVARSIYKQESSSGKNTKTSNAGAVGGMQILPGTFKGVADKDWSIDNPEHNARAGIRYLKQLDKQAGGDPALTAAGYYGGPGGLEKARKGIAVSDPRNPNAPNTLEYGAQVASRVGKGGSTPSAAPASPRDLQVAAVAPQVETAAPAQVLGAAPSQVAAGGTGAPVMMGAAPGNDPWQSFLAAMSRSQPEPVASADLNFGPMAPNLRRPVMGRPASNVTPNFDAFSAWKTRLA